MTPPEQALNFFASGSTDPDAKEKLAPMNWYGNDAMWVILPPGGEMVGRLFDKIPPYRMRYGTVFWQARRLDGAAIASRSLWARPTLDFRQADRVSPNEAAGKSPTRSMVRIRFASS